MLFLAVSYVGSNLLLAGVSMLLWLIYAYCNTKCFVILCCSYYLKTLPHITISLPSIEVLSYPRSIEYEITNRSFWLFAV
jgi:uncharacterized membrane protein